MENSQELNFSSAIPGKRYWQRKTHSNRASNWSKAYLIRFLLMVILLKKHTAEADEDWANLCPSECKCTWIGGKKTAECQGAGYNTIPVGLSSEIRVLDLSFNSISQLNKNEFGAIGLVNLHKVFLMSCEIEKIDRDAFRYLKIMTELDLSGNKLTSIHMEAFESNEGLRELRLNENPLRKLDGVQFPPLLNLQLLDLSNCQLSQLSKHTFDKLFNLEQLFLTGNKFQFISEKVLKPLIKLKSVSLENNPWKCDCRLRSFRDWVIARKFYLTVKCAEPSHLKSIQWSVLQSIDFACKPELVALQIGSKTTKASIVGSDLTLECLVRADPAPQVNWIRHGRVLVNSSRIRGKIHLLHSSGECERWVNLTILKSDVDDGGEYTCVGKNKGGTVMDHLTLKGPGLGSKHGPCHDHSLLWIFNGVLSSLVIIIIIAVVTVSFYDYKRRVRTDRVQDLELTNQIIV